MKGKCIMAEFNLVRVTNINSSNPNDITCELVAGGKLYLDYTLDEIQIEKCTSILPIGNFKLRCVDNRAIPQLQHNIRTVVLEYTFSITQLELPLKKNISKISIEDEQARDVILREIYALEIFDRILGFYSIRLPINKSKDIEYYVTVTDLERKCYDPIQIRRKDK
jgi:hypothetical protein